MSTLLRSMVFNIPIATAATSTEYRRGSFSIEVPEPVISVKINVGGIFAATTILDSPLLVQCDMFSDTPIIGTCNQSTYDDGVTLTSQDEVSTSKGLRFFYPKPMRIDGTYNVTLMRLDGTPLNLNTGGNLIINIELYSA